MKKITTLFIVLLLVLAGCNDQFLEKYPRTSPVEVNAFESYDNFKAFVYPLYDMFTNNVILTNYSGGYASDSHYLGDFYAGYIDKKGTSDMNPYAWQTVPESTTGNGWDFTRIRRINIMLSHIDGCKAMTDAEKNHWKAVGYFFHSWWYMMLINRVRGCALGGKSV